MVICFNFIFFLILLCLFKISKNKKNPQNFDCVMKLYEFNNNNNQKDC